MSCWEPPYQGFNLEIFRVSVADRPLSGFHFFGVSLRGFHPFRNFNSGISAFSGFQFGDPRLFGVSIRGFLPFRAFNSEIPAFSGFQFGHFRLFGLSIRRSPPFRGFNSGISSFRFGDPHSEGFSGQFWEFAHFSAHFRFFFSGKWVHFRVFFRAVGSISGFLFGPSGPFRASGSISGVLFGQVGPFRGLFSGDWVHFVFFLGAIGSILGISLGRLGPFFCFFKSLVPFRGFCSGNVCSILGDVSCNWVELGESLLDHARTIPFNFFCLSNSYKAQNTGIFGEDFLRIMVRSGLPLSAFLVLAMALILFLQILVQVHGNGYLTNRPPQPPVGPASPPHSVGSQAPPQKAPKIWKILQGILSVKLNLWFPSKQFGTPQEIRAKNV